MSNSRHFHTAAEISDHINGHLIGDPALVITGLSAIESDQANTITFFGHPKYEKHIYGNQTRAVLVPDDFLPRDVSHITFIRVENVYEALSQLSVMFTQPDAHSDLSISPNSVIDENASLGKEVRIGHFAIISPGVLIGDHVIIHDQAFLGEDVSIGDHSVIHAGVKIMRGVEIGRNCIIYPNAVIGSEGFGHALSGATYKKINHQGTVIIEDDVEIGSNTCIDRGAISNTIIRKGAKLDNLIQIAHGVEVGENVAIAAQTGISGSSKIGRGSQLGGQVGVIGHIVIAPDSRIQGQSGIARNINTPGKKWYGYPILAYYQYLRSYALFKRLPELFKRIKKLEDHSKSP